MTMINRVWVSFADTTAALLIKLFQIAQPG